MRQPTASLDLDLTPRPGVSYGYAAHIAADGIDHHANIGLHGAF